MSVTELDQDELSPGEELYKISEQTNDDGSVDVEIYGWTKFDDKVEVEFILPTQETFTKTYPWPRRDSEDYEFIRLLRKAGASPVDLDALEGAHVPATDDDIHGWRIDLEKEPSRRQKVWSLLRNTQVPDDRGTENDDNVGFIKIFAMSPLPLPLMAIFGVFDYENMSDFARGIACTTWILLIWFLITVGILWVI